MGAISNDLEQTLTLFSRSGHSFTLNISQTATDTAIVTIDLEGLKANRKLHPSFHKIMVPFSMTLMTYNPHFKVTILFNVK